MSQNQFTLPATIKAKIHVYSFGLNDAAFKEYHDRVLVPARAATHPMECLDMGRDMAAYPSQSEIVLDIELETSHLFNNQWNAVKQDGHPFSNARVFDYYRPLVDTASGGVKLMNRGHWIEITDEMRDIRARMRQCGYCGVQYMPDDSKLYCDRCLGSEYLKEKDLPLLRLVPVSHNRYAKYDNIAFVIPEGLKAQYQDAQARVKAAWQAGQKDRLKANAVKLIEDHAGKVRQLQDECNGLVWWLERGMDTGNLIYYPHEYQNGDKGVFVFGWSKEVTPEDRAIIEGLMSEFPYQCRIGKPREYTVSKAESSQQHNRR